MGPGGAEEHGCLVLCRASFSYDHAESEWGREEPAVHWPQAECRHGYGTGTSRTWIRTECGVQSGIGNWVGTKVVLIKRKGKKTKDEVVQRYQFSVVKTDHTCPVCIHNYDNGMHKSELGVL